jgi:hypothetical protein
MCRPTRRCARPSRTPGRTRPRVRGRRGTDDTSTALPPAGLGGRPAAQSRGAWAAALGHGPRAAGDRARGAAGARPRTQASTLRGRASAGKRGPIHGPVASRRVARGRPPTGALAPRGPTGGAPRHRPHDGAGPLPGSGTPRLPRVSAGTSAGAGEHGLGMPACVMDLSLGDGAPTSEVEGGARLSDAGEARGRRAEDDT